MQTYIGVKVINAKPMTRKDYKNLRGLTTLPDDHIHEDTEEGYLVEYDADGGKPNTEQFKGYISWSPKEVFEKAYRQTDGMTFGLAIEALKTGKRVARKGWNGKGMWLKLEQITTEIFIDEPIDETECELELLPSIAMKTADDKYLIGWLASQTDILAEDWCIVK